MKKQYDYLIVGAGLFGSVVAYELQKRGARILIVDRRNHFGGNCWTRSEEGINVHEYGAHIFRTNKLEVWNYIRQFAEFNHFINSPIAMYHGKVYNMPFNMNTFNQIWGVRTPAEAQVKISEQRKEILGEPKNLEEKAISLVGRDVYEILVKEYTEKQWGRKCNELPASIIRRLPFRLTYDNNYFNDPYQGVPVGGYTKIFESLLSGCEVRLGVDYVKDRAELDRLVEAIVYTGPIDEYFGYVNGPLEYRSLRFEHQKFEVPNMQGVAVVNYTDNAVPYTRTIEHKHFEFGNQSVTIVSKEFPFEWRVGIEPYYPINDEKNQSRYLKYEELAGQLKNVSFGGRLGTYRYTDMQDTICDALNFVKGL